MVISKTKTYLLKSLFRQRLNDTSKENNIFWTLIHRKPIHFKLLWIPFMKWISLPNAIPKQVISRNISWKPHWNKEKLTENLKFGRKKDVSTIFVPFDMWSDLRMSSRTWIVAVAVNAIRGISNFKDFKLLAPKFSRNTDNRLKHQNAYVKHWSEPNHLM